MSGRAFMRWLVSPLIASAMVRLGVDVTTAVLIGMACWCALEGLAPTVQATERKANA